MTELTTSPVAGYTKSDNLCPCTSCISPAPEPPYSTVRAALASRSEEVVTDQRQQARQQRRSRRQLRTLAARECGAHLVPTTFEVVPKPSLKPEAGDITFGEAQAEADAWLRDLARRPDIDEGGPDIVVGGHRYTALRLALLQRLARHWALQKETITP